jgi:lactate dehydrogenase-like 2-hydroxyacid dehydrogenase
MKPDILVTSVLMPPQLEMLQKAYTLHRYDLAENKDALLAEAGKLCTGVVASGHFPLTRDFLKNIPAARIVACSSVGYDSIDVEALTEHGIRFTNTPDVLTDDVADIAILLMLAARRCLLSGDRHVRSRQWGRGALPLTTRTRGSRAGIVGLGRIGQAIADRCVVMGQEIGYHARTRRAGNDYTYFEDPVELAEWADVLIAATPGGVETQGIISQQVLQKLGPTGTFINISRGSVVDEPALIEALRTGTIASAGLDVYENEPNPDPAFAELQNTVLYPHHASGTRETREAMSQLVVDNLAAFYAGEELLTPVNRL